MYNIYCLKYTIHTQCTVVHTVNSIYILFTVSPYLYCAVYCTNSYRHATISIPETNTSGYTPVHMYWTAIPDTFQLTTGENAKSWSFVLSLDQSNQSAETHFLQGVSYITSGITDVLLQQHTDSWEEVWTLGSIEIDGDLYLYKVVYI